MATCQGIAVHPIGAGTPEAALRVRTKSGTSARTPQALVDVPALLFRIAVVSFGASALTRAWQVHAQRGLPAGTLVFALINVGALFEREIYHITKNRKYLHRSFCK